MGEFLRNQVLMAAAGQRRTGRGPQRAGSACAYRYVQHSSTEQLELKHVDGAGAKVWG